jgi:hypothetical protein
MEGLKPMSDKDEAAKEFGRKLAEQSTESLAKKINAIARSCANTAALAQLIKLLIKEGVLDQSKVEAEYKTLSDKILSSDTGSEGPKGAAVIEMILGIISDPDARKRASS